jgi:hypothetical protein
MVNKLVEPRKPLTSAKCKALVLFAITFNTWLFGKNRTLNTNIYTKPMNISIKENDVNVKYFSIDFILLIPYLIIYLKNHLQGKHFWLNHFLYPL